jgi:hypothetical protein
MAASCKSVHWTLSSGHAVDAMQCHRNMQHLLLGSWYVHLGLHVITHHISKFKLAIFAPIHIAPHPTKFGAKNGNMCPFMF